MLQEAAWLLSGSRARYSRVQKVMQLVDDSLGSGLKLDGSSEQGLVSLWLDTYVIERNDFRRLAPDCIQSKDERCECHERPLNLQREYGGIGCRESINLRDIQTA